MLVGCWGGDAPNETVITDDKPKDTVKVIAEVPELATVKMQFDTVYSGSNIFFNNPYSNTGVGWCVKNVWVNEDSTGAIETKSFEIDLAALGFSDGDSVSITLIHEEGCLPEIVGN